MGAYSFHRLWRGVFLLFFFLAGCTWMTPLDTSETRPDAAPEKPRAQEPIRAPEEPAPAAKAHLSLAWLHLSYRNPKVNYPGAYQEMKTYLALAPQAATDDLRNWLAALEEMERLRKRGEDLGKKNLSLQTQVDKLHAAQEKLQNSLEKANEANRTLRDEAAALKETNAKLKETIEQLKNLDLQMEEKRRIFR